MLIRVTPGIKPSTHDYITTGQLDSKFGFGLEDGLAARAIERVLASEKLELVGLHAHIGSQIFELEPYTLAIRALGELAGDWCQVVNVGGGLGVAYTAEDEPPSIDAYVDVKVRGVAEVFGEGVRILVEPGRSLVANAGVTAYRVGTVKEIPGVRTYVAVDGGMSDNLRPMLYGSRYEALIADRAAAPAGDAGDDRRHALRVRRRDRPRRDAGRAGRRRRPRHPGHRRLRLRDGQQLQRRAAAAGRLLPRRRGAGRRPARDLRGPDREGRLSAVSSEGSKPVRIGLLGRGTVGAAFAELLAERADAVEAATGRRPEIAGVLTRSEGDFGEILAGSDLIVELMGGTEPARELRAGGAARPASRSSPPTSSCSPSTATSSSRSPARPGCSCASRRRSPAVIPIVRTIQESFGVTEISKVFGIVNGTTNFILTEMAATGAGYDEVLARAQELGYAEADPTDDVSGADAAAKMAILARLAFHTPVTLAEVAYEGIEAIQPDDLAYAKELGLSLKLLGVAERRDGGISVRVFPCFLYRGHPLAPIEGPFNAVMVEAPAITEVTMSGPGAGGLQTASAVLGDVVSILAGDAPVHETRVELPIVADVGSSFYLHLEVADRPGVLARVGDRARRPRDLGQERRPARHRRRRAAGDGRSTSASSRASPPRSRSSGELDELRSPPRSIRVIEEEY